MCLLDLMKKRQSTMGNGFLLEAHSLEGYKTVIATLLYIVL